MPQAGAAARFPKLTPKRFALATTRRFRRGFHARRMLEKERVTAPFRTTVTAASADAQELAQASSLLELRAIAAALPLTRA